MRDIWKIRFVSLLILLELLLLLILKTRVKKSYSIFLSPTYISVGGFFMTNFSDGFFKRIEKKTNVNKQTILDLAKKLQENDLKNENTLREVIQELSQMTGREVSKEKEDKIVNAVVNDNVPKDIDKMF
jgi:hypothetical protein